MECISYYCNQKEIIVSFKMRAACFVSLQYAEILMSLLAEQSASVINQNSPAIAGVNR